MKQEPKLRILFLEDLVSDFDLAKGVLERNGFDFDCIRVENEEGFLKGVKSFKPDVIISDYMMPTFNGFEALKLALEFHPKIPFIILTGSMNEATAVKCLKTGADDYVIKEHIERLPYSVKEILEQKDLNAQKVKTEKALKERESAYRLMFDSNPQPMWVVNETSFKFLAVNQTAIEKYGYTESEFLKLSVYDIILPEDYKIIKQYLSQKKHKTRELKVVRHRLKDGSVRFIEAFLNAIKFEGKDARLVLLNDVTEKGQAEKDLLQSEENFRQSLAESPLGIRIVTVNGDTIYANKAFLGIYEFDNLEEYNTTSAKSRYTSASFVKHQERKQQRKNKQEISEYEVSIIRKSGELRHVKVIRNEILWNGKKHYQVINQDVTEQINAYKYLKESEEKFRVLAMSTPLAICIYQGEKWVYVNPAAEKMSGFSAEELYQSRYWDFIAPEFQDLVKISGKNRQAGINPESPYEFRIITKQGISKWVYLSGNVIELNGEPAGIISVLDISDLKQAEGEKAKIYNSVQTAVYIYDFAKNKNEYINPEYTKLLGWTLDDINKMGNKFMDLFHPDDYQHVVKHIQLIREATEDNTHILEYRFKHKNGQWRWCLSYDTPFQRKGNGDVEKMLGSFIDITERKQTEENLIKAKEKAEESDRLKSAFLANMSHEIRTPLNSIIGFSNLLIKPEFDLKLLLEFGQIINTNGSLLLSIINDIVDISKIEAGITDIRISKFSVNKLLTKIIDEYGIRANEKGIDLRCKLSKHNEELIIESDEIKLRQIIVSLTNNAIKFTKNGFIEFEYSENKNYILFQVKDTGIGIAKENHGKIFDRFFQIEAGLTREYGGNGLGLNLSKSFVELLGGKIWVESDLGKGSTFYFTIPTV